ncbi:MAG TPA: hypothetical protein VM890_05770 [Longimicrobium sp.]|jgi:type VI protein secretion system component VasK|nr:hypothetical protein [Longimicrobium sp.]
MSRFWTRTRRYLAAVWLATAVLEVGALEMARRTNSSWFLLLAFALLAIPIAGVEMTTRWTGRAPRKRWKRHDVEDALAAGREPPHQEPVAPRVVM